NLKNNFRSVRHFKPPASRSESKETYLVAQGFKG
ncbi:MAG: 23S rRNA methyltransferase, partial [Kordiimonadaceae bacterium]|nr:23S rRNA methyltransferase [Kordiimonadaceae bacterium]